MATYGARFRSPLGFVQIDQNYVNHALRQKGSLWVNADSSAYIELSVDSPILAFRCTSPCAILRIVDTSPGVKAYWFHVRNAGAVVEWFLFDRAKYGTLFSTPYGLRVRNSATGETVFDSRTKYLRVTASDNRVFSPFSLSQSSGRAAIVQGAPYSRFHVETVGSQPNVYSFLFWTCSFAQATAENTMNMSRIDWDVLRYDHSSGGGVGIDFGPPYERPYSSYMLVDVTDY